MIDSVYDLVCASCEHPINDHDANECWATVDGDQCPCHWMEVTK